MKRLQFPTPSSTLVIIARAGALVLDCFGSTKPTDGTAGYAPGCTFRDTTNGAVYVNEGSATSCDFDAVTTA